MSMPREDSTPHSRDPTPRNVAGQDQTSDQEFSVPLEEGLHFISLLESALRVGTGVPENAPVGVVTPTSDSLRSYLSSANMSVWQQFVRNRDIRKNQTIAMAVKLQVLDPAILCRGYLLVKPEDQLGAFKKKLKKATKAVANKVLGDDSEEEEDEMDRVDPQMDTTGKGDAKFNEHKQKLLDELTYGRDQAAKMLQAHKEAKKKGERMIDKTLKGTLKSVKELGKMAANVTELAVETTAKSLNVMEKAAMEAAEKTIERSKEMARLAAESGQAGMRGDLKGVTQGMTNITTKALTNMMSDAKGITTGVHGLFETASMTLTEVLEHQTRTRDSTTSRLDHVGDVDPEDPEAFFNNENKYWDRKFFGIIEKDNKFWFGCWLTQPPSMLEHDTGVPPVWCIPINKILVEPLTISDTKLCFKVVRDISHPVESTWPDSFTLKMETLAERETWLNMYESALAIPLAIFLGMHSLRPLNPVARLLEMHESLDRFEYSRVDPNKLELEAGLAHKVSLSLEEFNLDSIAVAITHLMPLHNYCSPKSLGIYSPLVDRMFDVVLKYKMADKECIRGIAYLCACFFRMAGERVASHMLHFATARYTAEHAGGLRLKPLTEALVYFAGIMTERGEDEMALKLLKDLDWKLTELHNLYPQDDTIVVMRGHVRYDIAMKLKRQGDYTHLETLLVGCAQDYESSLGSDARELEGPLSQLAEVMAVSERHHHAFKLIDRVEKLMNMHRTAGAMTAVEASQRIMLTASRADALAWAGRLDRAHPMLNEAMDMAVEKFGVTHHMVASMLLKKGTLTFQTGGIVDAMCYYEEAAEVYEELEFSDLGTLSGPIKRLVGIYMLLGRNDMALALIEQYIVLVQADPANRSSELSEVSLILRMLQRACGIGVNGFLGREDPAFIFAQTQPVINFTDQDGNPMTVDDLVEGANRRYNRGEFDEALRLQERCVYEMREHLGEMHPLVAQEVKFLGAIYQKEEMYTDALACYQEATAMFIRALGEDHPQTAQALNYQGVCECAMMKFEESAATMERVVEIYKRNLHKEHPTLSSAQRLAGHCNLKADDIDRAYEFFEAYTAAQPAQKTLSLNSGLAAANSYYIMAQILTKRYNFTAAYNCATIAHKIQVTELGNQHITARKTGTYLKQLSFLHSWATSSIAMQSMLFKIDDTVPMLFGGKSAKDLYLGLPDRASGKERGSANKKSIRNENRKSAERKAADAMEEAERQQRDQSKSNRLARFSRSRTVAFVRESERKGQGDGSTILEGIVSFLRQMPAETLDDPDKQKPIDDLMDKVKQLAAMIHIDTGRPLHRGFYKSVTLLKKQGKKLGDMDEQAVLFDRRTDEEIEAERLSKELQKQSSLNEQRESSLLGIQGMGNVIGGASSLLSKGNQGMGNVIGGASSLLSKGKGVFSGLSSATRSSASASQAASESSADSDPNAPKKSGWGKLRSVSMKLKQEKEAAKPTSVADVAVDSMLVEKQKRRSSIMRMGAMAMKKAMRGSIIGTAPKGVPITEHHPDAPDAGTGAGGAPSA